MGMTTTIVNTFNRYPTPKNTTSKVSESGKSGNIDQNNAGESSVTLGDLLKNLQQDINHYIRKEKEGVIGYYT